jgi:outer membrane protein OmpA-like peptidoglycan-associated protein
MKTTNAALFFMAALLVCDAATAQSDFRRFVSCPIYRDTDAGRKSGCWLGTQTETSQRFDVSNSPDKPLVGRQMLVEGVVSNERDICGAVVLQPVRISVLQEPCPEIIIPAEGWPSKPSTLPPNVIAPLAVPRKLPQPPFEEKQFHLVFDYDSDFLVYQSVELTIENATLLAQASKAKRVLVTGYADTKGVEASGRVFKEPLRLAKARAEMTAEALRRMGVPANTLQLSWRGDPTPLADHAPMHEASKRRVTVTVQP